MPSRLYGGDLALERTLLLRAHSEQIEIEAEARLRRVDVVFQKESHSPTITGRNQFDPSPDTDKTVIDNVINRICVQENVIRHVIKHAGDDITDDAFGIRGAVAARVGGISCTVRWILIQVDICVRGQKPVRPVD